MREVPALAHPPEASAGIRQSENMARGTVALVERSDSAHLR
jgi:hypothetical protein